MGQNRCVIEVLDHVGTILRDRKEYLRKLKHYINIKNTSMIKFFKNTGSHVFQNIVKRRIVICMKLLPIKPKFIGKVRPRKQKEKVSVERKKFERYSIRQQ